MKNNITEIVFILDMSGSMYELKKDTMGGFNSTVEKQKKGEGEALVSTILFNNRSTVLHDRVPIEKIKNMTEDDYRPNGGTALLDAIGDAVKHVGIIHKYAREEDVPEHTVFVITTDGYENSSYKYTSDEIKKMIKRKQEENGWEFIFLGANIDSVETADRLGIRKDRAANYCASKKGVSDSYDAMCYAIKSVRCDESLDDGMWKKNLKK